MSKQLEHVVFSGSDNTRAAFASSLKSKLKQAVIINSEGSKKRTLWDSLNDEYIQDLACVVTDIIFKEVSYKGFSDNPAEYNEMLDKITERMTTRVKVSSGLKTDLFAEIVKYGVSEGYSYIKTTKEKNFDEMVEKMSKIGKSQLVAFRSIATILENGLYKAAEKRRNVLFPSKHLRKQLDDDMLQEAATTVLRTLDKQHIIESMFFTLTNKRIKLVEGEDVSFDSNDIDNCLQNITSQSKNTLFKDFDIQMQKFQEKAKEYFERESKKGNIKYIAFGGLAIIALSGILIGSAAMIFTLVTKVLTETILPISAAISTTGICMLIADGALTTNQLVNTFNQRKIKKDYKNFVSHIEGNDISKSDVSESIIVSDKMLDLLNPISNKQINKTNEVETITKENQEEKKEIRPVVGDHHERIMKEFNKKKNYYKEDGELDWEAMNRDAEKSIKWMKENNGTSQVKIGY
jgi:hypothetical protein